MPIQSAVDLALNLSRFDAHTRAEVNAELLKLEKELKTKLQDPSLSSYNKANAEKLLSECETVIAAYYGDISDIVKGATDGVVGVVVKATAASLALTIPPMFDVSLPTANMMKAIMSDVMVFGSPLADWWDKQGSDTTFKFQAAVRQGLIQGETNQQLIKRVLPVLDVSRRNAQALVQTSVQSVANSARMATYAENDDLNGGFVYVSTLDSRTCIVCSSLSGSRWDANKKPLSGKQWVQVPRHVGCRCIIIMQTKSWKELGVNLPEPKAGTRASDEGQVSVKMTFDEFLKGKTKAYQDDRLGKGRADLWRRGKITLSDLTNGATRPLTLKELEAKYL